MQNRDYIIDQIDNIAQFIAKLVTNKKTEIIDQTTLNLTLSALTGLDSSAFAVGNVSLLKAILPLIADNNSRAMVAFILQQKSQGDYKESLESLMADIEFEKLDPRVKALFSENSNYLKDIKQ